MPICPILCCYCSHLPLLQVPQFPFQKPSKWDNPKKGLEKALIVFDRETRGPRRCVSLFFDREQQSERGPK